MRRSHRLVHRLSWPVLIVVVATAFTLALALRPPPDEPPAAETQTQ
jgi:hypothetical protein